MCVFYKLKARPPPSTNKKITTPFTATPALLQWSRTKLTVSPRRACSLQQPLSRKYILGSRAFAQRCSWLPVLCWHPLLKFMVAPLTSVDPRGPFTLQPPPPSPSLFWFTVLSLSSHPSSPGIPDPLLILWICLHPKPLPLHCLDTILDMVPGQIWGTFLQAISFQDSALRIKEKKLLYWDVSTIPCLLSSPHFPRYSHNEGEMQGPCVCISFSPLSLLLGRALHSPLPFSVHKGPCHILHGLYVMAFSKVLFLDQKGFHCICKEKLFCLESLSFTQ